MKKLPGQKWILSSLLIAALGSQYYFSASSKNSGLFEMSELAAPQIQSITDITAALERTKVAAPAVAPAPVAAAAPSAEPQKQKTEGVIAAAPCPDCVTLTAAEAKRIREILVEVTGKKVAKAEPAVAETVAEKMKREREEREEKRKEEKLAKEEKLREEALAKAEKKKDEQAIRDEKFRSDYERLSKRCSDVDCYSSTFALALNRYTSKDKLISPSVVKELFEENIAKELKDGLKDPENKKAQSALETLMADIPSAYKSIKNKSIDMAKSLAAPKAVEANASFKLGAQLGKANKVAESNAAYAKGREQKTELEKLLASHDSAITAGFDRAEDKSTLSYYNSNYAKPASQWLIDIQNSTNFSTETVSVTVDPNANGSNRGVVRGGNGNTTVGNPLNTTDGKITTPNTNGFLNNVQFGSQQPQGSTQPGSRGGGRTSY